MDTTYISATELKNNTSEIINKVFYEKTEAIIERHGKPIVKIVPIDDSAIQDKVLILRDSFGSLPDFPKPKRYFRKRNLSL